MLKWVCLWLMACCSIGAAQNYLMVALPPYLILDTFNRYPNGSPSGTQPLIGTSAWGTTGAQSPVVVQGKVQSSGTGYLFNYMGALPQSIGTYVTFSGGSNLAQQAMTIAISIDNPPTICNVLHFNFGPQSFTLDVRQACGSFNTILTGTWTNAMSNNGTLYRLQMDTVGNTVTIHGPSGETFSVTDSRVSQVAGPTAFWEPNLEADGLQAGVPQVYAYAQLHAY
jgi:hypothetical protein